MTFEGIGLIKSQWKKEGEIVYEKTGTGLLIRDNIVLTCAHLIYSSERRQFCDSVMFYLSKPKQPINLADPTCYPSRKRDFYRCPNDKVETQNITRDNVSSDYAVIILEKKTDSHRILELSELHDPSQEETVMVMGYPSDLNSKQKVYKGTHTWGKVEYSDGISISYTSLSLAGHSGSPVMLTGKDSFKECMKVYALHVGIEGKNDEDRRIGVLMTKSVQKQINNWISEF